ncbi:MAG: helix-turn-helix transcriptional regulator [Methylobacillus sp.]|jgi:transcriptional regulator with XRE-family HTH domain|nr:helix-turn-helix transcriptional regulator [Methylobacillus sp.]
MSTLNRQFGFVVRHCREQRRWSQEVLADAAGLNRSYLGEIERGAAVPSLVTIAKLAGAFDLRLSELMEHCEQGQAR